MITATKGGFKRVMKKKKKEARLDLQDEAKLHNMLGVWSLGHFRPLGWGSWGGNSQQLARDWGDEDPPPPSPP